MIKLNVSPSNINNFSSKITQCVQFNYSRIQPRQILPQKINPKELYYIPPMHLGELINSGREARVYAIKEYDDLVARVAHDSYFAPHKLRPTPQQTIDLYATVDKKVAIQKRIAGEPLHGKFWEIYGKPSPNEFHKSLDKLENLPDEAFSRYMDEVITLRQFGLDIDNINPNNLLIDSKNKRINIVDIEENIHDLRSIHTPDFYQFLDSRRLTQLVNQCSDAEKEVIIKRIQTFLDRIRDIGAKKGLDLSVEPIDYNKLQNNVVYLYHNDKTMLRHMGF